MVIQGINPMMAIQGTGCFQKNKNKKVAQGMGSTRSARRTQSKKARQDVGLFYVLNLDFVDEILC
ncbi:hypothetical protein FYN22_18465 (plasmid) [Acinetobacter johnsonii]|nr:hypothetical protein FYN22_18465 [Acinetobacter johnsonii]